MPSPRRVGPQIQSSADTERSRTRSLPPDLLKEASTRLGILALIGAALWLSVDAIQHVVNRANPSFGFPDPVDIVGIPSAALSLALFGYARRRDQHPQRVLNVGLAYLVATAIAVGILAHLEVIPEATYPTISWSGALVLMFAAIIPMPPIKMLIFGLLTASVNPVVMLIARARGVWTSGSASEALTMHIPDYLLVGVATVISHVVTRLGVQVARAREMGSYQLGELIGRGGMGEVYRATHRMLARPAAIKLIRPEMLGGADDAESQLTVRRFRREAESASSLRSPHTVELYDFGVTDDGTLYFVMEMLDGLDLDSLVREAGPLPAPRAIYVLRQVCESLAEAHARGIVHRDIKPANIHVGRLGLQHDFVKVLDFGLAKPIASGDSRETVATEAGFTPGTPSYMAPEMALGETIDGRADLYAVGCVAYYLLTGKPVFDASTSFQMIARHMRDLPSPPSTAAPFDVPPALDRIVLACLEKSPADRPQSAGELSRELGCVMVESWSEDQARAWWSARESAAGR